MKTTAINRFFILLGLLLGLYCLLPVLPAQAASPADVDQVIMLMRSTQTQGLISRKYYPTLDNAVQAVFVHGGLRYTFLHYRPNEGNHPSKEDLAIWIRPVGTTSQEDLVYLRDIGPDGNLDYAESYLPGRPSAQKKYQSPDFSGNPGDNGVGLDNFQYWQNSYVGAIQAALKVLRRK